MSLVVAYKRNGVVYMGADSQSTCGTSIERLLYDNGFKISRMSNGMLVGVCGRVLCHQRIVARKKWFDIPEGETFDKQYIVKKIIPELNELMNSFEKEDETCNSSMEVSILIAWKDRIFFIESDYIVYECVEYAAIGAGATSARYLLSRIGEGDDVREGLLKALRSGAHFDSTVSAPFVFIDTERAQYEIVEE